MDTCRDGYVFVLEIDIDFKNTISGTNQKLERAGQGQAGSCMDD